MKSSLAVYLTVVVALLIGVITTPESVRGPLSILTVMFGTTVFTVSVARRRPQPWLAWWLVVASAWSVVAVALAVSAIYGLEEDVTLTALAPALLTAFPYPLLATALALLTRVNARRGPVDTLDAIMVALAGFLMLWVFAIEDRFILSPSTAAAVIVLPVSGILVFALTVKLALGGGLRDPATALLILVVAVLLVVTLRNFILGLESRTLRSDATNNMIFSTYGPLLGAIGLLPSFTRPRRPAEVATYDLSTYRLVLFSVIVLVPLVAWAHTFFAQAEHDPMTVVVSLAVSALFLVTLVIRLALLGRLAQRRADDLRVRSAELASAVSEQQTLQERLRFQATHDPLTGLANRVVLTDRLTAWVESGNLVCGALVMIDLDGFKRVNDTYGHLVGDELLVETARRLVAAVPSPATLARLGGDEFVVLLDNADREAATHTAEQVVAAMREPYRVNAHELQMTASVGVVIITPDQAHSSTALLRDADAALYQAKKAGGGRAVIHEPVPERSGRRAARL